MPSGLRTAYLGVDIFVSGYGGMVVQGIFARPDLFRTFAEALNENGLFPEPTGAIDDYIAWYDRFTDTSILEIFPISEPRHKISIHRIADLDS